MELAPKTPKGKHLYELDEDGYVVVEFVDQDGNPLDSDDVRQLTCTKSVSDPEEIPGFYQDECLTELRKRYPNLRSLFLKKTPDGKEYKLFAHQIKGISYMLEHESLNPNLVHGLRGGIIKMQMGMGKTLCAIVHSVISPRPPCLEKYGENGFPTLVVASKTVMLEWKSQGFEKFFGSQVKVLYLHIDYLGRNIDAIDRRTIVKYDFVVTSYDVCSSICRKMKYYKQSLEMGDDHSIMKDKVVSVHLRTRKQSDDPSIVGPGVIYTTPWERVICDESQRFANPTTQTYRHIMAIYGRYKWCLTGTPIRNYDTDIWAQLRFCGYTGVEMKQEWKRSSYIKMKEHNLSRAILNMNYTDAGIVLPPRHEHDFYVTLAEREKDCYDYVHGVACHYYDKMMAGLCNFVCVLALFTRLRQCSIAPYLITAEAKREKGTHTDQKKQKEAINILKEIHKGTMGAWVHDKHGTAGIYSKKISEIVNTIKKIPKGEKVLIFSMFTSVLDLLADALKIRLAEFEFVQVDGDTIGAEREEVLGQFRKDKNIRGLLITYKVGSEGLNLVEATHVICIEPWWTNAVHNQAKSRCHRTGQTQEVHIHNIYVKDSIEDRIVEICKEKDILADNMLEGTTQKVNIGIDKYTLGKLLGAKSCMI